MSTDSPTEANKQVVRAFYEAGNRGDMETASGLIADDITWTNIGSTALSGTFRGKGELMEKLLGPLFAQLEQGIHMTVNALIAEGDRVVALSSGKAKLRDGRSYDNEYCQVMTVRDARIVEVMEYLDTQLVGSRFGFAPGEEA